jgi:predicted house-cleaning noncanonical NTP pyrophosphatase (MazG superfamily)
MVDFMRKKYIMDMEEVASILKNSGQVTIIEKASEEDHYKSLAHWVADYKAMRKYGNVRDAKKLRDKIKAIINRENLDADRVWGVDPDDPANR